MAPGQKFKVTGTPIEKLDFVSLMLALSLGAAALPHILIRYYTVPNPAAARKSTIVAIAAIGFFYILTLIMGLGAMFSDILNPADSNMSAPLLAKSFGSILFAVISAVASATVLGAVSGLIVAASGAVAHDLMDRYLKIQMDNRQKICAGKISAFVIGAIAIVLGILFKGMNVTFLVGLAFAVAASANLPAVVILSASEEPGRQANLAQFSQSHPIHPRHPHQYPQVNPRNGDPKDAPYKNTIYDPVSRSKDLSRRTAEPTTIFRASEAAWSKEMNSIGEATFGLKMPGWVTDGPEMFRTKTGKLGMLWSSWGANRYVQGIAYSTSGKLKGPWVQEKEAFKGDNSGHGMLFTTFEGKLLFIIHHADADNRKPQLYEVDNTGDKLILGARYNP